MSTWAFHKIDTLGWLQGSIRIDMTSSQRGVWSDLIALASNTRMRDGTLRFAEDKPMPREYIANTLNITVEELNSCINVCIEDKNRDNTGHRINIWEDGTIELMNFDKYQKVSDEYKNKQVRKNTAISKNKEKASELGNRLDEATSEVAELRKDIHTATQVFVSKGGVNNG